MFRMFHHHPEVKIFYDLNHVQDYNALVRKSKFCLAPAGVCACMVGFGGV